MLNREAAGGGTAVGLHKRIIIIHQSLLSSVLTRVLMCWGAEVLKQLQLALSQISRDVLGLF